MRSQSYYCSSIIIILVILACHTIRIDSSHAGIAVSSWRKFLSDSPYRQGGINEAPTDRYRHAESIILQSGNLHVDHAMRVAHQAAARRVYTPASLASAYDSHRAALDTGIEFELHFPRPTGSATSHQSKVGMELIDVSVTHWLIHLSPPITNRIIDAIHRTIQPFRLGRYLPHHTYLLTAPESIARRLSTSTDVILSARLRMVARLPMSLKFHTNLLEHAKNVHRQQQQQIRARGGGNNVTHVDVRLQFAHPIIAETSETIHQRETYPTHRQDQTWINKLSQRIEHQLKSSSGDETLPSASLLNNIEIVIIDGTSLLVRIPWLNESSLNTSSTSSPSSSSPTPLFDSVFEHCLTHLTSLEELIWLHVDRRRLFTTHTRHARYVIQTDRSAPLMEEEEGDEYDDAREREEEKRRGPFYYIGDMPPSSASAYSTPYPSSSVVSGLSGLRGEGQIVTIGDSGLDYDSCFFHDPAHPIIESNQVNPVHRKVLSYVRPFPDSIDASLVGDVDGHGTFVAGSLGGSFLLQPSNTDTILSNRTRRQLSQHDGIAPGSKLVIFDFGEKTPYTSNDRGELQPAGLKIPLDLYTDYLLASRNIGSRISSNSWGEDSVTIVDGGEGDIGSYDSYSLQIDEFLHTYPDYTFLMSAGNSGVNGLGSISSPGDAKNILTVGSTHNTISSRFEQGFGKYGVKLKFTKMTTLEKRKEIFEEMKRYDGAFNMIHHTFEVIPAIDGFGARFMSSTGVTLRRMCLGNPSNGCGRQVLDETCQGGIILVERGTCSFTTKARHIATFMNQKVVNGGMMLVTNSDDLSMMAMTPDTQTSNEELAHLTLAMVSADVGRALRMFLSSSSLLSSSSSFLDFSWPHVHIDSSSPSPSTLSDFSSKGPTRDGRIKPDIIAPGEWIVATKSTGRIGDDQCGGLNSNQHEDQTKATRANPFPSTLELRRGTSMSTPLVAGVVALIRQYFQDGWYRDPVTGLMTVLDTPSASLLKAIVIHSGVSIVGGVTSMVDRLSDDDVETIRQVNLTETPSFMQGFGRVQLDRVLPTTLTNRTYTKTDEDEDEDEDGQEDGTDRLHDGELYVSDSSRLVSGAVDHYCFVVTDSSASRREFRVTLVWTDPPPSPIAGMALVNNLDLIVVAHTGPEIEQEGRRQRQRRAHIGNTRTKLSETNIEQPSTIEWDMLNNVEQVIIPAGMGGGGVYTVLVRGTHVPYVSPSSSSNSSLSNSSDSLLEGQSYSLVVTGGFTIPTDGIGACTLEGEEDADADDQTICPNSCTDPQHGRCQTQQREQLDAIDSNRRRAQPGRTFFDPSFWLEGGVDMYDPSIVPFGSCLCFDTWVGADCSTRARSLEHGETFSAIVPYGSWTYLSYRFDTHLDLDFCMSLKLQSGDGTLEDGTIRFISKVEPNIYILIPRMMGENNTTVYSNYPTQHYWSYFEAGSSGSSHTIRTLHIPRSNLTELLFDTFPIMIGLFGDHVGISHVTIQIQTGRNVTLSDGASTGPSSSSSSSSSTGSIDDSDSSTSDAGITLASSSTGIGVLSPDDFLNTLNLNLTYSCPSVTLRLSMTYTPALRDDVVFKRDFERQIQSYIGLTTWSYDDNDTSADGNNYMPTQNRVRIIEIEDGGTNDDNNKERSEGHTVTIPIQRPSTQSLTDAHPEAFSSAPFSADASIRTSSSLTRTFHPNDFESSNSTTLVSFVLLPSSRALSIVTHLDLNISASSNPIDLLSSDDLLTRLVSILNIEPLTIIDSYGMNLLINGQTININASDIIKVRQVNMTWCSDGEGNGWRQGECKEIVTNVTPPSNTSNDGDDDSDSVAPSHLVIALVAIGASFVCLSIVVLCVRICLVRLRRVPSKVVSQVDPPTVRTSPAPSPSLSQRQRYRALPTTREGQSEPTRPGEQHRNAQTENANAGQQDVSLEMVELSTSDLEDHSHPSSSESSIVDDVTDVDPSSRVVLLDATGVSLSLSLPP